MEKTFRRMTSRPSARHAYVEAEVITGLAHQVRILRLQRGWTQRELALRLETTQAAVSRLEDPSYGRYSLATLLQLSKVFDTGLQVRFISLVRMLRDTWHPRPAAMAVVPFKDEAESVGFVTGKSISTEYTSIVFTGATAGSSVAEAKHVPLLPSPQPPLWVSVFQTRADIPVMNYEATP